ncbi:hypothetical protein O181_060123, partial [Austropuccinia psidii MF-1]|nr:hypothetical protein [Austropuccinia psidii MF-1]
LIGNCNMLGKATSYGRRVHLQRPSSVLKAGSSVHRDKGQAPIPKPPHKHKEQSIRSTQQCTASYAPASSAPSEKNIHCKAADNYVYTCPAKQCHSLDKDTPVINTTLAENSFYFENCHGGIPVRTIYMIWPVSFSTNPDGSANVTKAQLVDWDNHNAKKPLPGTFTCPTNRQVNLFRPWCNQCVRT